MTAAITLEIPVGSMRRRIASLKVGYLFARFEGTVSFSIKSDAEETDVELIINENAEVEIHDLIFGASGAFSFSGDSVDFSLGGEFFSVEFSLTSIGPLSFYFPLPSYTIQLERDLPKLGLIGTAVLDLEFLLDFIPNFRNLRNFVTAKNIRTLANATKTKLYKMVGKAKFISRITVQAGRSALIAPLRWIGNSLGRFLAKNALKLGSQMAALGKLIQWGGRLLGAAGILLDIYITVQASIPGAIKRVTSQVMPNVHREYTNGYADFLGIMTDNIKVANNDKFVELEIKVLRPIPSPPNAYGVVENLANTGEIQEPDVNIADWRDNAFLTGLKYKSTLLKMTETSWIELYQEAFNLYWIFLAYAKISEDKSQMVMARDAIKVASKLAYNAGLLAAYQDILRFVMATSIYIDNNTGKAPTSIWEEWIQVAIFHQAIFGKDVNHRIAHYKSLIDQESLKNRIPPFIDFD